MSHIVYPVYLKLHSADSTDMKTNSANTGVFYLYLDLEGPLEATGKEAPKGSNNGGKGGESNAVDLERIEAHCGLWTQEGISD